MRQTLLLKMKGVFNRGKTGYLAKNSLLFTVSSFGSRLLGYFLIPLYTSILSTAEMGLSDVATTTSSLLFYAVTLSIGDAVFVYAMDKRYDKDSVFKYGFEFTSKGLLVFSIALVLLLSRSNSHKAYRYNFS